MSRSLRDIFTMNRIPFILPLIVLSLLIAIWAGWIRIGFNLPANIAIAHHGSLMVNCFLASLIFLERAVTFRNKWVLLLPFLNAFSVVLFTTGFSSAAFLLNIIAAAGFLIMCGWFIYRHKELYYYVFFAGAFCLLSGNMILFRSTLYPAAVVYWMEFLLFTIVAERLELTRFLPVKKIDHALLIAVLAVSFLALFIPFHKGGNIVFAVSLIFIATWLLKYDMAFKSVKLKGQHRYSGLLLIAGYVWLMITAMIMLIWERFAFGYDAMLHSFFIGFVFAMIFSHAPVILPAVMKRPLKLYRPMLYVWFALLQVSLIVRVIADILNDVDCRKYAGLVNGISLLLFFITIAVIAVSEWKRLNKRSVKA
jgi:hypothetical protein